jgi:hypothetical protein
MPAYELYISFQDGKLERIGKFASPVQAENQIKKIFKEGYRFKQANTTYYYPASSVIKAELTYYEKMEPED